MKTYVSDSDFYYLQSLTDIPIELYELRNKSLFDSDTPSKNAFRMLCEALITSSKSYPKGLNLLRDVAKCVPSRAPCNHICCPACRTIKQKSSVRRSQELFNDASNDNTYFITALLPMTPYLSQASKSIDKHRKALRRYLNHYIKSNDSSINVFGAYEYDLKTVNEYKVASERAKQLFSDLGYKKDINEPMWLPHLHALISPINDKQREDIRSLIHKATYDGEPIGYGVEIKSLRSDKDISENLSTIASYMWKARLQHSDNIFASTDGKNRAKYKSMFASEYLYQLASYIKANGSFKALKFEVKG